jgi:hypothetical protein
MPDPPAYDRRAATAARQLPRSELTDGAARGSLCVYQ